MDAHTIVLIAIASFWAALEGGLILRDRGKGKGKTDVDGHTRLFNFVSMTLSPAMAAAVTAIPIARDLGVSSVWILWIGVGVMALGLGLRIWSVAVLGEYFRTTIELERGQRVVQTGPYRLVRHPSYSGLILTCIGFGVALQNLLALLVVVTLPTIALLHRIDLEEGVLADGMGKAYRDYQGRTRKLIPWVW